MRRTERLLLAFLVAIVLLWQGNVLFGRFVLRPIQRQQREIDTLNNKINDNEVTKRILERAEDRLRQRKQRSLPREPLTAQRLYQQWLTDLAQDSGFDELRVDPQQVTNRQHGTVGVVVSIQAQATLDQLCLFMDRFHRTDLLHQITSLNIQAEDDRGNPPLRLTIMTEGLILPDAENRNELFPAPGPGIGEPWLERPTEYQKLVTGNPFARPNPPVVATPTPKPKPAKKAGPDAAKFTYLVAAIMKGEQHEAWLFDRLNNRNLVLVPGAKLAIGNVQAVVLAIGRDHVLLDRDNARWRLRVGTNLRAMERMPEG